MELDNLSSEVKSKLMECKSLEELTAIAAEEGIELSEEQLEAFAGGVQGGALGECMVYCKELTCIGKVCPDLYCEAVAL